MHYFLSILLTVFTVGKIQFELVPVEGGTFEMGGTIEQRADEGSLDLPVHPVALSSFYIGKTEVTRGLWKTVMGEDAGDWKADDLPIEWVSWTQCQEFISRLNEMTGQNFRLPTEAEWEYAARGGRGARQYRYSGSRNYEDVGWLYLNSDNRTHAVGQKQPNALGLYDMTGNVWEWCSDWFAPYDDATQIDPQGPAAERVVGDQRMGRVIRGSSWDNSTLNSRLSVREGRDPDYSFYDCGLRLAMDGERMSAEDMAEIRRVAKQKKVKSVPLHWSKDSSMIQIRTAGQKLVLKRVDGSRFAIMDTEVTQSLWSAVMKGHSSVVASSKGGSLPMNNLSYTDCVQMIFRLDSISGLHFRLPTSEEWELAATGGSRSIRYADSTQVVSRKKKASSSKIRRIKQGNVALDLLRAATGGLVPLRDVPEDATLAEYGDGYVRPAYTYAGSDVALEVGWVAANSNNRIQPVHKLEPNEIGVFDMTGNVAEWTSTRTESGQYILRGGAFTSNIDNARLDHVVTQSPDRGSEQTGFRLVLDF